MVPPQELLTSPIARDAFDLSREPAHVHDRYGRHVRKHSTQPVSLSIENNRNGPNSSSPYFSDLNTPSYAPSNVYRNEALLPSYVKRVAVLPLTTLTDEASMDFARDSLWPVLLNELGRSRQFELVTVPPEELRLLTGRSGWSGEEKLPVGFFEKLKDKLGVDAILFCRLTQYRAYEPLAVGWRLKLLDAEIPRILWAVDEVFDARVAEVAAAARRYAREHPRSRSVPA